MFGRKKKKILEIPEIVQIEAELNRERCRHQRSRVLRNTIFTLITVAAATVLVSTLWMSVLRIYGTSMSPTLSDGNIVISLKGNDFHTGDIVAFYYNNKILVKRVIAGPGDWVNIDQNGVVYVNDEELQEPYLTERALGDCSIQLPYQIPENRLFVMGDHRSVSVDSRNTAVGCVAEEQIVGKIIFCIWPFSDFSKIT